MRTAPTSPIPGPPPAGRCDPDGRPPSHTDGEHSIEKRKSSTERPSAARSAQLDSARPYHAGVRSGPASGSDEGVGASSCSSRLVSLHRRNVRVGLGGRLDPRAIWPTFANRLAGCHRSDASAGAEQTRAFRLTRCSGTVQRRHVKRECSLVGPASRWLRSVGVVSRRPQGRTERSDESAARPSTMRGRRRPWVVTGRRRTSGMG